MSFGAMLLGAMGAPDRTPAAKAVNWGNISDAFIGTNADQTISGITAPINLRVDFSSVTGSLEEFDVIINSGSDLAIALAVSGTASSDQFQVVNGDTVHFRAANSLGSFSATATVVNVTTGVTLDTFSITLTG